MLTRQRTANAIAVALTVALAGTACGERADDVMQKAFSETRKEIHEESITLSQEGVAGEAELTPEGDLLIDGEPVPMDARQREAALAYRGRLLSLADAGLVVGQQGAVLGGKAAALAVGALFGGGDVDVEERKRKIEAEAEKIEAAAQALCQDARTLEVEQARFAQLVPEFAPYAREIDIDSDCKEAGG